MAQCDARCNEVEAPKRRNENALTEKKLCYIRILSEDGMPVPSASDTRSETSDFGDVLFDTVIVGGNTRVVPTSPKLLAVMARAARSSRQISSICTGVFALADAGLIGERRVRTHRLFTDALKVRFPQIKLEADSCTLISSAPG